MADRIGIELSPFACRIVELPATRFGHPRLDAAPPSLTILPRSGPATQQHLATLRGRRASVVIWGLHSDHRQVVVTDGSYDRIRSEAKAAARAAGVPVHGTLSDVAPAGPLEPGTRRRVVVLATAPAGEVAAALRMLREAQITVESVRTPASALVSLARLRGSVSSGLQAHVAIGETATTVALTQAGFIRFARDFAWGSLDESTGFREPTSTDDVVTRLAADLGTFVDACGSELSAFEQIALTGSVPELRSVAIRLTQLFDVEIEPLDYSGGLDLDGLAKPIDRTGVKYADVWLAWAAAADRQPLLDLYRDRRFHVRRQTVARVAVAAGVALGVGVGWGLQGRISTLGWFSGPVRQSTSIVQSTPPVSTSPPPSRAAGERVPEPPRPTSPPPTLPPTEMVRPATPAFAVASPPPPTLSSPSPSPPPLRSTVVPPPRPSVVLPPPLPAPRASALVPSVAREVRRDLPPQVQSARPQAADPLPAFDAVLGTILYGPDRKLAVVDNRIVQVGDEIRGAVVVEIAPTAVLLRDAQGRLRRLSLGTGAR